MTVAAVLQLTGCSHHEHRLRDARAAFYQGNVTHARDVLAERLERGGADRDVVALDLAMAQLFAGDPGAAELTLRGVRDRFDHLQQQDWGEAALALVADDNRLAYAGEDYEQVLIRVMLALANLCRDGQDAHAYSLQVNAKQQEIIQAGFPLAEDNPKRSYPQVAVGAYLRGVLREATHGHYDDAERSFAQVVSWQPDFAAGWRDLERSRQGRHSLPGQGVVYVFAFVGRGPQKVEAFETPTSEVLLIADRILSAAGPYTLPPTIAPIKMTQLVLSPSQLTSVRVDVDGHPAGSTETITDVGRLAVQQHQAIYNHLLARAVARRVAKKAAVVAAKSQVGVEDPWVNLVFDAAGVVWEATESADIRGWTLLPDKIQVLRLEVPTGRHRLTLHPARASSVVGAACDVEVAVEDGRNTYLLACFPETHLAGKVLVSSGGVPSGVPE